MYNTLMKWSILLIFILIIPFVYPEECDWEIKIIPHKYIFEYNENVNFTVSISRKYGPNSDIFIEGRIFDISGNMIENYHKTLSKVANERNPEYHPRLPENNPYIIQFNISEITCNDTTTSNNLDEKLIFVSYKLMEYDYSKLKISEFFPHPTKHDASMPEGEWVELYNSGNQPLDIEKLIINDDYGNGLNVSNTNILQNTTIVEPHSYIAIYRNHDGRLELNNEGYDEVKLFYKNILLDKVSYSYTKEGLSWSKVNNKWILTYPTPNEPNEIESPKNSSHLEIETVYLGSDNKAKFGDQIRVRVNIYKGDTTKYNLDVYIKDKEQISKRSEINLYENFKNYVLTIPIQIEPNCNQKYPDGTYTIYLTGFDETTTKEIEIKGINEDLCKVITETVTMSSVSQKEASNDNLFSTENQQIIEDNEITGEIIYESSDVKAKNVGIYFFAGVLLIVIIYLIVKKTL
jgi:hypothetical protein